jgi:hypothetical protein
MVILKSWKHPSSAQVLLEKNMFKNVLIVLVVVSALVFSAGCDMQNAEVVFKAGIGRLHPENGNFKMVGKDGAMIQTRNLEGDQATPQMHESEIKSSSSQSLNSKADSLMGK